MIVASTIVPEQTRIKNPMEISAYAAMRRSVEQQYSLSNRSLDSTGLEKGPCRRRNAPQGASAYGVLTDYRIIGPPMFPLKISIFKENSSTVAVVLPSTKTEVAPPCTAFTSSDESMAKSADLC